jgi:hypothetical protein
VSDEKIAGGIEKVIEIEQRSGALVGAPVLHEAMHGIGYLRYY